jgi:hypothetical protein
VDQSELLLTQVVTPGVSGRLAEARALLRRAPAARSSVTPLVLAAAFAATAALAAAVTMIMGAPAADWAGADAAHAVRAHISSQRQN